MKIANPNKEYIHVNEANLPFTPVEEKVHLVKLGFEEPTEEKMDEVLRIFDKTNRFIIEDNIKFYNDYLKNTSKKYYVENKNTYNLISFFRKNNKVLLNLARLEEEVCSFIFNYIFFDVLKNVEVIKVTKHQFNAMESKLKDGKGNVVITDV